MASKVSSYNTGLERSPIRSCSACKSKKTRCDKKTPCSSCASSGRICTYPSIGPRVRRTNKTIMAEMAGRIASLERNLAKATAQGNMSRNTLEPNTIADKQDSQKDLLVHKGPTSQYLNEILVARVVGEVSSTNTAW
jgi:hypothetical protein